MLSKPNRTGLEVETVGDATVARFTRRSLLGEDLIEALSGQLLRAVEVTACRKLVLNFGQVESMTTGMVGKLVALKKKVEADGGRLALCGVDPFLLQIFKILNLAAAFAIHDDEQAALQSF